MLVHQNSSSLILNISEILYVVFKFTNWAAGFYINSQTDLLGKLFQMRDPRKCTELVP